MGQVIKVRCNGANKHVNEVDLDEALRRTSTLRSGGSSSSSSVPERTVLRCRKCTEGKVVVTRAMVEEARR